MGALRRAGVWLGLVEEDPEYGRTERERYAADDRYNRADEYADEYHSDKYSDEYGDDYEYAPEFEEPEPVRQRAAAAREEVRERPRATAGANAPQQRATASQAAGSGASQRGGSVSPIGAASSARTSTRERGDMPGFATNDNLALAPQVALRERAVVAENSESYRITTLHPTTYNEARTIGEHFRNHIPVIMNLTEMDESDAKRLVDFAAGLAFGLRGSIERVTNRVFLLSPASVTVTAEDRARIAEGGFFNQS